MVISDLDKQRARTLAFLKGKLQIEHKHQQIQPKVDKNGHYLKPLRVVKQNTNSVELGKQKQSWSTYLQQKDAVIAESDKRAKQSKAMGISLENVFLSGSDRSGDINYQMAIFNETSKTILTNPNDLANFQQNVYYAISRKQITIQQANYLLPLLKQALQGRSVNSIVANHQFYRLMKQYFDVNNAAPSRAEPNQPGSVSGNVSYGGALPPPDEFIGLLLSRLDELITSMKGDRGNKSAAQKRQTTTQEDGAEYKSAPPKKSNTVEAKTYPKVAAPPLPVSAPVAVAAPSTLNPYTGMSVAKKTIITPYAAYKPTPTTLAKVPDVFSSAKPAPPKLITNPKLPSELEITQRIADQMEESAPVIVEDETDNDTDMVVAEHTFRGMSLPQVFERVEQIETALVQSQNRPFAEAHVLFNALRKPDLSFVYPFMQFGNRPIQPAQQIIYRQQEDEIPPHQTAEFTFKRPIIDPAVLQLLMNGDDTATPDADNLEQPGEENMEQPTDDNMEQSTQQQPLSIKDAPVPVQQLEQQRVPDDDTFFNTFQQAIEGQLSKYLKTIEDHINAAKNGTVYKLHLKLIVQALSLPMPSDLTRESYIELIRNIIDRHTKMMQLLQQRTQSTVDETTSITEEESFDTSNRVEQLDELSHPIQTKQKRKQALLTNGDPQDDNPYDEDTLTKKTSRKSSQFAITNGPANADENPFALTVPIAPLEKRKTQPVQIDKKYNKKKKAEEDLPDYEEDMVDSTPTYTEETETDTDFAAYELDFLERFLQEEEINGDISPYRKDPFMIYSDVIQMRSLVYKQSHKERVNTFVDKEFTSAATRLGKFFDIQIPRRMNQESFSETRDLFVDPFIRLTRHRTEEEGLKPLPYEFRRGLGFKQRQKQKVRGGSFVKL
jgi:hypothetical protein